MRLIQKIAAIVCVVAAAVAARGQSAPAVSIGGSIGVTGSQSLTGQTTLSSMTDANYTLSANEWWAGTLVIPSSVTLTNTRNIVIPSNPGQHYCVANKSTGSQSVQMIAATGTGTLVTNSSAGATCVVFDGTNTVSAGGASTAITALTGDGTATGPGSAVLTLATVNLTPGACGDATHVCAVTTNGKGLVTAQTATSITFPATLSVQTNATPNASQTTLNFQTSTVNATGLTLTPANASGGNEKTEVTGTVNAASGGTGQNTSASTGVAQVGAGTWSVSTALANGTTATTQAAGDTSADVATDSFVATALTGGIAKCPLQNPTNLCITQAPYYASGSAATSTTTAGSGSTTIATSCSGGGWDAATAGIGYGHQGIAIPGAGAAGAYYIGRVTSCVGTTMVITPATSTSVTSATVYHEETAAFQAAINALNTGTGGTIWVPNGTYYFNGPLQDTGQANAILTLPKLPNYVGVFVAIGIKGYDGLNTSNVGLPILQTFQNAGNFIGGKDTAAGCCYPPFTNATLDIENLTIIVPDNPTITALNMTAVLATTAKHLLIRSVTANPPTTGTGIGLAMPAIANAFENIIDDVNVAGFGTGAVLTEHTQVGNLYSQYNTNAVKCDNGTNSGSLGTYNGNSISVDYLWAFTNTNGLVGGTAPCVINIQNFDTELNTLDVLDSSNVLRGKVRFLNPYGTPGHNTLTVTGATNLNIEPLYDNAGVTLTTPSGGGFGAAANFVQEGTTRSPNASISNPSAGVLSFDTTAAGNALATVKGGPATFTSVTDSGLVTANNLVINDGGGLLKNPFQTIYFQSGTNGAASNGFATLGAGNNQCRTFFLSINGEQQADTLSAYFNGTNWVHDSTCNIGAFRLQRISDARTGYQIALGARGTGTWTAVDSTDTVEWCQNAPNMCWVNPGLADPTVGTVMNFAVNPMRTVDNAANVQITTSATGAKGLVVQGTSGQTANLQEWQNNAGSVLASISAAGVGAFAASSTVNGSNICTAAGAGGGSCATGTPGTVTSIATTGPITGGTITSTGTIGCATCGVTGSPLSQFASTTSAQLAGVLSDETGTGVAVFSASPALSGTPTTPTAVAGTGGTQVASQAYADASATAAAAAVVVVTPNKGSFVSRGRTTDLGSTTLLTTSATAMYRVNAALDCTVSSAAAQATYTVTYTDTSSTVQTIQPNEAAICTTLGASSQGYSVTTIHALTGTTITLTTTTLAGTPTYDVAATVEQLTTN